VGARRGGGGVRAGGGRSPSRASVPTTTWREAWRQVTAGCCVAPRTATHVKTKGFDPPEAANDYFREGRVQHRRPRQRGAIARSHERQERQGGRQGRPPAPQRRRVTGALRGRHPVAPAATSKQEPGGGRAACRGTGAVCVPDPPRVTPAGQCRGPSAARARCLLQAAEARAQAASWKGRAEAALSSASQYKDDIADLRAAVLREVGGFPNAFRPRCGEHCAPRPVPVHGSHPSPPSAAGQDRAAH
jgi:hypothetical protein